MCGKRNEQKKRRKFIVRKTEIETSFFLNTFIQFVGHDNKYFDNFITLSYFYTPTTFASTIRFPFILNLIHESSVLNPKKLEKKIFF